MSVSVEHVVFPAVAFFFFLAFLVLLALLGKLAARATQGPPDGRRGCLGGCGLFAVLVLLCALGIAGFVAFALVTAAVTAVEHNPVQSVELIHAEDADAALGSERPSSGRGDQLVMRFEVEGDVEPLVAFVKRRFDLADEDVSLRVSRGEGTAALIELWLPLDSHDVEELRRELESSGWELPGGVRVKLRDSGYPR